jgi:hypothetical protein
MSNKYVVRCTRRIACDDAGLGNGGYYRKGDFVTEDGAPTRSLNKAFIYGEADNEFPIDDWRNGELRGFFEFVPVKLVLDE